MHNCVPDFDEEKVFWVYMCMYDVLRTKVNDIVPDSDTENVFWVTYRF
jgi:hypothetical protein